MKLSKNDPLVLTLDDHYSHSRNIEVIDCAQENGVHIICLPPHSILKLKPLELSFMQPLKSYYWAQEIDILLKNHPELLHTIELLNWLRKLSWNRPRQLLLQTVSGKQACFPETVTYLTDMIMEESQGNITSGLLENPVPHTEIAVEKPTTRDTNPQTLTYSHSACFT